jgi:menaquinol-cytochrome c reductase iron-sulfur subunit
VETNATPGSTTAGEPPPEPSLKDRRRFLARLSVALGAIGALAFAVPVVGFIIGPLLRRVPSVWRSVGRVDDFKPSTTTEVGFLDASPLAWGGVAAKTAAWLRRHHDGSFTALAVNCTHLGCPVRWLPDAELFMCPCHGGVYYADGRVAAGPPPRPLARYRVRVRSGQVEIETQGIPIT